MGFLDGPEGKESACNAGDTEMWIRSLGRVDPWVGTIPWRRKWQPAISCLENPTDRRAWWATVQRVPKSQTQLSMQARCIDSNLPILISIF